ncbi:MAG: arginase family protein [Chthoniobacteraceae bacterium]
MDARHFDLDGAWPVGALGLPTVDLRDAGPELRFCTTRRCIDRYREKCAQSAARFVLFGSGDFHHLTAVHLTLIREPVVLISFDNHPDWDRRPPRWQCGAWVNRALELDTVREVHLWGCTSADVRWPGRWFASPGALRSGRLNAHLQSPADASAWCAAFVEFADRLAGRAIYVTVDLDCLAPSLMSTNWDAGTLELSSLVFALNALHPRTRIVGADLCGGWSEEIYARPLQRFAARLDHPKLTLPPREEIAARNLRVLGEVWPALTGQHQTDAHRDQHDAQHEARR